MRRFIRLALIVATIFASAAGVSSAGAGEKEFFLNSGGFELFGGANRISVAPGLNFGIFEWLQFGASVGYESLEYNTDSAHMLTLSIGPTLNLGGPTPQATFIFLGYAHRTGSGYAYDDASDASGGGVSFMVGKRVPLFGTFSYRPSMGLQLAGKATFVLNALALSYVF